MKILFITEISPFPINGGERIRSYGLLKALSKLGHQVDAIIGNKDQIDLKKYTIEGVNFHENNIDRSFFSDLTLSYYYKKNLRLKHLILDLLKKSKPEIAFIDYGFLGHYISLLSARGIPVIYGTHNAQSEINRQLPLRNLIKKMRKQQRLIIEQYHERHFFKQAQSIITVSEEDKRFHADFYPENNIYVIPNFLDESKYMATYDKENYFIMTANFNAYQNFEGIKWFLQNVWDTALDKKQRLLLAGIGSDKLRTLIPELKSFPNIELAGKVENIIPYIAKAKAVIIPLIHGSGSRLKCLEAMALKTPIISTRKGVEGIKSEHITIADDAESFKQILGNFTLEPVYNNNLYSEFLKEYSLAANYPKIQRVINKALE